MAAIADAVTSLPAVLSLPGYLVSAGGHHESRKGTQGRDGLGGIALFGWRLSGDRNASARACIGDDDEPVLHTRRFSLLASRNPLLTVP